jgi:cytochrome oxidase assembly protein ShyY1
MRLAFRFRLIPFIATVLLVVLGIALGNWQERRAAQKIAISQKLASRDADAPIVLGPAITPAAPMEFRRVRVSGEFLPDWPVFLDNRPYQGRPGFYLLMPLKITGSDTYVLVARGWLPRDMGAHDKLPDYATPSGPVAIEGRVVASAGHVLQLGTPAPLRPKAIVQNLEVGEFARASGLKLQPFFVEQLGPRAPGDALVRDWPAPQLGIEKHQGYAFQWYALAAMAFLFFVITGFRSGTTHHG